MVLPSVTAAYLAILALIYAGLSLRVAGLRRKNRALFGDAGSKELQTAIRVHAHFAEYVPIISLLVAIIEMSGASPVLIHVLMGALLVTRLLHPLGLTALPGTLKFNIGRVGVMVTTALLLAACALLILFRMLLAPA